MSGKPKTRWTNEQILNADVRTMDAEECIALLRSRGVSVPEGRVPRSQLSKLLQSLKNSIMEDNAGTSTPAPEGRKRANSARSKTATKAATKAKEIADDEMAEATPTRPRRRSSAAAVKKAAAVEPEEEEEEEPEKKKRRSSVKRATTKAKSVKRAAREDGEQEQEQEEMEQQEQEEEQPQKKRKSGAAAARGKKRGAEKPIEEVVDEGKEAEEAQAEEETNKKKKTQRKSRASTAGKAKRKREEPAADEVSEQPDAQPDAQREKSKRTPSKSPAKASATPVKAPSSAEPVAQEQVSTKRSFTSIPKEFFSSVANRVSSFSFVQKIRGRFASSQAEKSNEATEEHPAEVDSSEEVVPVGTHASNAPIETEVVEVNEAPARKRIVVTPKLEITALSISLCLIAVFLSLFVTKLVSNNQESYPSCGPGMIMKNNECIYSRRFTSTLKWVSNSVKRFLSRANYEYGRIIKEQGEQEAKSKLVKKLVVGEKDQLLNEKDFELIDNNVAVDIKTVSKIVQYMSDSEEMFEGRSLDDAVRLALEKYPNNIKVEGNFVSTTSTSYDLVVPLCILLVVALVGVGIYYGILLAKRYCDKFVSTEKLKDMCCLILKEQAEASAAQAEAQTGMENPSVMPAFLAIPDLKKEVMNELSPKEQSSLVVRFRMFRVLRSLKTNPSIRTSVVVRGGKSVETLKWAGKIDD